MKPSSNSTLRQLAWIGLYCFFAASAIASAVIALLRSTTPLLVGASVAGILTGLLVGVAVVGGLSFVKNRQVRLVAAKCGHVPVIAVEGQHDLTRALRLLGVAAEDAKIVTVSLEASGVTFWRGVMEPQAFARISIDDVRAWDLEPFMHGVRTYERLVLLTVTANGVVRVPVCANRPGFFRLRVAKAEQIEQIMGETRISRAGNGRQS